MTRFSSKSKENQVIQRTVSSKQLISSLKSTFQQAQTNVHVHEKLVFVLHSQYIGCIQKSDDSATENLLDVFGNSFMACIKRILIHFKKSANIDRVMAFVASFLKYDDKKNEHHTQYKHNLRSFTLESLVNLTDALDKAVRYRSIQLIASILDGLGPEASIGDDLWKEIAQSMIKRTFDKIAVVRVQSVLALKRLQDPEDLNDPVTTHLNRLMTTDTSFDVRKVALESIALTTRVWENVLSRINDVHPKVRSGFYDLVRNELPMQHLSIRDRVRILTRGLRERDDQVKKACVNMLQTGWLPSVSGDPIRLLDGLDLESNEELGMLVATTLLSQDTDVEWSLIPSRALDTMKLTPSEALYWKAQCQAEDAITEELIPDIVAFVALVKSLLSHRKEQTTDFLLKQLLTIGQHLDFADDFGKRQLEPLLQSLIQDLKASNSLVEPVIQLLYKVHPTRAETTRFVSEIIAELTDPLVSEEKNVQQGDIQAMVERVDEIDQLLDELSLRADINEPSQQHQYQVLQQEADHLNNQIDTQTFPVQATLRALEIVAVLLRTSRQDMSNPIIFELKKLILSEMQHENDDIRALGITCLGLYSLLDEDTAAAQVWLFLQVVEAKDTMETEKVQVAAMKVIADLVCVYPSILEHESFSISAVEQALVKWIQSSESFLKLAAVEIACKLLLFNRSQSTELLARLAFVYFVEQRDASVDQEHLVQVLAVFFSVFTSKSEAHCLALEKVVPLCLSWSLSARDPHVEFTACANNLLSMLKPQDAEDHETMNEYHMRLAVELSIQVLTSETLTRKKQWMKALTLIFTTHNKDVPIDLRTTSGRQLKWLLTELETSLSSPMLLKTLAKLQIQSQAAADLTLSEAELKQIESRISLAHEDHSQDSQENSTTACSKRDSRVKRTTRVRYESGDSSENVDESSDEDYAA